MARTYVLFTGAVILTSALLCFLTEWYGFHYIPAKNAQVAEVYIPTGSSIQLIAQTLKAQGVLERPRAFVFMARLKNLAHAVKAGEYLIPTGMTPAQLLRVLVAGKVRLRELTFVEGWRFTQLLGSLAKNPYLQHDLQGKSPQDIMAFLGEPEKNPEGGFYPDTYKFARGTHESVLLKQAHALMTREVAQAWQERAADLPYASVAEAVIVASLIEKETAVAAERAQVAGVILRRLQLNMPLQIDATVIYGLGDQYTGRLSHADLKVNSPYNTYLFKGLPPTPIAMPGKAALIAALHPAPGDAMYYVSKGDGSHEFSATLAAHNRAVNKLRLRLLTDSLSVIKTKPPSADSPAIQMNKR